MSSPLDEPRYNSVQAKNEKDFVLMYIDKSKTWIEKDEPILALDSMQNAISHTKKMWKYKEKAKEEMTSNEKLEDIIPIGMEIV